MLFFCLFFTFLLKTSFTLAHNPNSDMVEIGTETDTCLLSLKCSLQLLSVVSQRLDMKKGRSVNPLVTVTVSVG